MLWYDEYGAEWIKKVGKQSPDAYLQMALQLAFRKTQGEQTPTYETASTRLFKHGRTDVIRTFSEDSYRFVEAMTERKAHSPTELYALLTAATKAHNAYTRDSSVGKGCDRHFLGLKALMREGESHPLFDDELFGQSQSWVLSTSGLSAGDRFYGTGFGTVWPNGYGCNCAFSTLLVVVLIQTDRGVRQTWRAARLSSLDSSRSTASATRARTSLGGTWSKRCERCARFVSKVKMLLLPPKRQDSNNKRDCRQSGYSFCSKQFQN